MLERVKEFDVAPSAVADAVSIGVDAPDVEGWIRKTVRYAAPVTHEAGNWRYREFVFQEEDGVVVGVEVY